MSSALRLRPVDVSDVPACASVFFTSMEALRESRGEPLWPRNEPSVERLLSRLRASHPGGAWLAEQAGEVVGFAIAVERERLWFLAFLFVLPDRQAAGLGRRLLERAFPIGGPAAWCSAGGVLGTCAEASQPVAIRLYADYGLLPRTPIHLLTGQARRGALAGLPAEVEAVAFAALEATAEGATLATTLAELDLATLGHRRPVDHRDDRAEGRQGWLYRSLQEGRPLAYGYVEASGRVGPVAAVDGGLLEAVVGHLMSTVEPAGGWQLVVPGPSPALPALLRAGLRFDGTPELLTTTAPYLPAERYLLRSLALP